MNKQRYKELQPLSIRLNFNLFKYDSGNGFMYPSCYSVHLLSWMTTSKVKLIVHTSLIVPCLKSWRGASQHNNNDRSVSCKGPLRLCVPPWNGREDDPDWTDVCPSAHEYDHHRLHDDLLQVSPKMYNVVYIFIYIKPFFVI